MQLAGAVLPLNVGPGRNGPSVQKKILNTSEFAPESELSSTYTMIELNPEGHSAGGVQSADIAALPPVPFGVGDDDMAASISTTGAFTWRLPTFACSS